MKNFIMLAVALALAMPVHAETVAYEKGGVSVDVPAGWKAKNGDTLTIDSADGAVSVVFMALPDKAQDKAVKAVEAALDTAVGKVTWEDKPEKSKVNDLDAETWEGTAKDGKVQVEASYLEVGDHTVAVYWFDTKESEAKYKKDADTLWKSIKKK